MRSHAVADINVRWKLISTKTRDFETLCLSEKTETKKLIFTRLFRAKFMLITCEVS